MGRSSRDGFLGDGVLGKVLVFVEDALGGTSRGCIEEGKAKGESLFMFTKSDRELRLFFFLRVFASTVIFSPMLFRAAKVLCELPGRD